MTKAIIQGHRGYRAAWPENTLAGFAAAIEAGVDAIELDVGMTRDGVVVVCHDPRLDPDLARDDTGAWIEPPGPLLVDTDLAEIRRYDVGRVRPGRGVFPDQRPVDGARVPTLAEVFALVAGRAVLVDVELKTDPTRPRLSAPPDRLAAAVLEVARTAGAMEQLALRSFDWRGLVHAASAVPRLTYLTDAETDHPVWRWVPGPLFEALRVARPGQCWGPDHRRLTAGRIARAQDMGLQVVPWTVNDPQDMRRLRAMGVDGICTDDPLLARAVL